MVHESVEASEEMRWKVVKAMLDEFPDLERRIAEYLIVEYLGKTGEEPSDIKGAFNISLEKPIKEKFIETDGKLGLTRK